MNTRGAIIRELGGGPFEIVDIELESPRQGEVMVQMVASGLCHSDMHVSTNDAPVGTYPMCCGHEGAGVVVEVGPHTKGWEVGDHCLFSMLPGCGRCRWCARGMQNLCDLGATLLVGCRPDDPTSFRMSMEGKPVGQYCGISTFSEYTTVATESAIKIDKDIPLETVCLLSCGVGTGWGSAVNLANFYPGETVIVMGVGGIGINAVQGAAYAGAGNVIAVDPVELKRETALKLGATHAVASMEEATELAGELTGGLGADASIVTVGVVNARHVGEAAKATRKAGTIVVTGVANAAEVGIDVSLFELTLFQKRIQGSLFGGSSPSVDIPWLLGLYQSGDLKLDEIITRSYTLDQVNEGYADMEAGKNVRGIVKFAA
jgi:S-(hydroxymethyl)glutathione dehydrogenase/alcohol dehydrogenase